ncbi:MAG: hypothetical protein JOY99_07795 [Sphingomonadaceae bacterium]|nr:hypothetical protein [Sphingomonadaceae bacterium]
MVNMAKPWRHPKTHMFYLRRQIPVNLRSHFGGRAMWKVSLATREPGEATRLFIAANAALEARFDQARAALIKNRADEELSPQEASALLRRFLSEPATRNARWPSLIYAFWLEDTADHLFGTGAPGLLPSNLDTGPSDFRSLAGHQLIGDVWLRTIDKLPTSEWLKASSLLLERIFKGLGAAVVRSAANERALMEAFNTQLRSDNAELRCEVEGPARYVPKDRRRPQMRFGELLDAWQKERNPRPQSLREAKVAVVDLIDFIGDIPVTSVTKDMLFDYRDESQEVAKEHVERGSGARLSRQNQAASEQPVPADQRCYT